MSPSPCTLLFDCIVKFLVVCETFNTIGRVEGGEGEEEYGRGNEEDGKPVDWLFELEYEQLNENKR